MEERKKIALVAHDNCKQDLIKWVEWNWELLTEYKLICTGTTGNLVESDVVQYCLRMLTVHCGFRHLIATIKNEIRTHHK